MVNGVLTQVVDFTAPYLIKDNTTYSVKLVRQGNTLTIYRDNVVVATTSQATPNSAVMGFGSINDPSSFDELLVTQP
jgi:hypothetical protein